MAGGREAVGHPVDVASGMVYCTRRDATVFGRVVLTWERYYSTALVDTASPLGRGWTNRYMVTLLKEGTTYLFTTPDGVTEIFQDMEGEVERGGVVRNLGTFKELTRRRDDYVVTRWDVERGDLERYVFSRGMPGRPWPLDSIENGTGHALDIERDAAGHLISIRQRRSSREVQVDYTAGGQVSALRLNSPGNRALVLARYEYDSDGLLRAAHDAPDHVDRYEYNPDGLLRREVMKDGGVFSFKYDEQGRCIYTTGLDGYDAKALRFLDHVGWTEVTDSLGHVTRFERLPSGQIVQEVSPLGAIRRMSYDDHGRLVEVTDPLEGVTTYTYDAAGNRSGVTDVLGNTTEFVYDDRHLMTQLIDAAGYIWTKEYDERGLLRQSEDPLQNVWRYRWNAYGDLEEALLEDSGQWVRFTYDDQGNRIGVRFAGGATWAYVYDAAGHRTRWRNPMGLETICEYDVLGQLVRVQWPEGSSVHLHYDAGGRLSRFIDEDGRQAVYTYGPCGRLRSTTAPDGQRTEYRWASEPGRLLQVVYEGMGQSTYAYDAEGRRIREVGLDGRVLTYMYDAAGRVVGMTDGGDGEILLERDLKGRLIRKQLPDGTEVRYAYDALGNATQVTNEACEVRFKHDAAGRVVEESQGAYTVQHQYDGLGNRIRRQTSLGHDVAFRYDTDGCLMEVGLGDLGAILFERDALGREHRRLVPGGVEVQHTYDMAGRLVQQAAGTATRSAEQWRQQEATPLHDRLLERTYRYDTVGRLVAVHDGQWGETDYQFDAGDRLRRVSRPQGLSEQFDVDAQGRIVQKARQNGSIMPVQETLAYDAADRIVRQGDVVYSYDEHGRLQSRTRTLVSGEQEVWTYEWNANGQLARLIDADGQEWTYAYDGLGRRVAREGPDLHVHYVWDGDTVVHELEGEHAAVAYLFFPRTLIPLGMIKQGRVYTCVNDHLGTPRELIDDQGHIAWSRQLTAWGETEAYGTQTVAFPIQFCGQWYDPESRLCYNRFRMYDPRLGVYLSPDPLRLRAGTHLYRYTSDPTGWVDPLGLAEVPPPDTFSQPNPNTYQETYDATWDTGSQKPPRVEMSQSGSELTVHYVRRPDDFPHRGSDMVVAVHERAGLSTPESIVLKNVINQETLNQLNNGVPPNQTLLGRFGLRLAQAFGIQNPEVTVEDRRAQTCIVIR